ncbi:SusC/RagA family TonB-linked outer membrane protein [Vaginella massiliensis]|uniref:SusC/RagA family TonB-linked outer membrane protein n=1 Tax=Vaginella massiliensis TaxID=1816680 RepID=UPI003752155D
MRRNLKNLFLIGSLLLGSTIFAQVKTVTGTVTDADGFPVADAVVKTASGAEVYTDENGRFSIEANEGESVTVESFGLQTQTFVVGSNASYNVSLRSGFGEEIELEGAVVTALGITREKKSLGYATQEVSGDVLTASRQNNALNALSGNVAGLQISNNSGNLGGSTRIILRGIRSATGENRPLIVVNGVPMSNSNNNSTGTARGSGGRDYGDGAFDINPDDIESINVLKGAAASALYGSRGMNGVIMITTKRSKRNRDNLTVNTGVTFERVATSPKLQRMYGGGSSNTFQTVNIGGVDYQIVNYSMDESWGPKFEGQQVLHWDAFDPEFPQDYLKTRPWIAPEADVEDFYNTGFAFNNSLSYSSANEFLGARFSIGNVHQTGVIPNSKLDKSNLSLGIDATFAQKFKVESDINYVRTKGFNRPEFGYGDNSVIQKFYQWGQRNLDMNRLKNYQLPDGTQRSWNRVSWSNGTPLYSDNPYWIINKNTSDDLRDRFFGNFKLRYDILPGLYAQAAIYGDHYDLSIEERVAIGSQATSSYQLTERKFTEMNYEGRLHYDKKWDSFSVSAFAGMNRRDVKQDRMFGMTAGGLVVDGLYNLSNSTETPVIENYKSHKRVNSVFGGASFGFYDLFFVDVTARNDWSSTLPADNNSYFYPSVTGSFVFSQALKADWLNFGKIRGGWGRVGSDTDPYQLIDTYTNSLSFNGANAGLTFNGVPHYLLNINKNNPNLKPEMVDSWEVGIEMSMFKNRFGFDVTYYDQKTKDIILLNSVSPSTGVNAKWYNAGVLRNKGIEAVVRVTPVQTADFSWDVVWNFATNDNRVESLYEGLDLITIGTAPFKVGVYAVKGEKYGQIRGTDYIYDDQGNKVVGANGRYVASDVKNLGSVLPDYNMGFRNTFNYKSFSLGALIDVQKGGKFFSTTHMWGMYSGMLEETAANGIRENGIVLDGVTGSVTRNADGTYTVTNTAPNTRNISAVSWASGFYSGPDTQNIFDASYVKLREVTLSYTFPDRLRGPFSDVTVSIFGRNLATWGLDRDGFDPEIATAGSGNIQGIEGGSVPLTRTIGMNLKLSF